MNPDCSANTDPLKLVREGSSQPQRRLAALDPGFAPVAQRGVAHGMLFARAYAAFLKYYDAANQHTGDWSPFFGSDVSVQLADAALQDVASYKSAVKSWFGYLDMRANAADEAGLKDRLGYLFGAAGTLAFQLDRLQQRLPPEQPLKAGLQNLVRSRLAPALRQLLLYHRDGLTPAGPPPGPYHHALAPPVSIMGASLSLEQVKLQSLSADWIADGGAGDWAAYMARLDDTTLNPPGAVYGDGATLFERINHIATHSLFTSIFERFLMAYARIVAEAGAALETSLAGLDTHEPHYALFLAFLRLFEGTRAELNTLTGRHLDFYYRDVLHLRQKPARPGRVRLLAELAKQAPPHLLAAGTLFRAGKDKLGVEALFAADRATVLNQARVAALKSVYRHDGEPVGAPAAGGMDRGRLYASPVANSDDGLGAELTSSDGSWHPFHNKRYADGMLASIGMPLAETGFAVASHYLLLAQGTRSIAADFELGGAGGSLVGEFAGDVTCLVTAAEKWLEVPVLSFQAGGGRLHLKLTLTGAEPGVTPYRPQVHGYAFGTELPVLMIKLKHRPDAQFIYGQLQDVVVRRCSLAVSVTGLKTLTVSNDFGPVDVSKPFQPYGASPVASGALVVGSKEVFQKKLDSASLEVEWQAAPAAFPSAPPDGPVTPLVNIDFLHAGEWTPSGMAARAVGTESWPLEANLHLPVQDQPDLSAAEPYTSNSRHGFLRLKLDRSFGQAAHQAALVRYLRKEHGATDPGPPPTGPWMSAISMSYTASQEIVLDSASAPAYEQRAARFYHHAPFGQAEQHPLLNSARTVFLLPQFEFRSAGAGTESGGECYIGISGLQPPQTLSLLVQVAPGSADPLARKPAPHVTWSYLGAGDWVHFADSEVNDGTAGLLVSGIVTLDVPRGASAANPLLPAGMHWIRMAVAAKTDAVCRLLLVAAQGVEATFTDRGNDPAFPAQVLPAGAIGRLALPDPSVRKVSQPFAGFGGRGAEAADAFYTRISERLRHKDRAVTLWDVEHLVLEAFPAIYRVKCLNHTRYEPDEQGAGVYRELAPGHVTIVTIPGLEFQNLRDPLRPYTSLDLLEQVDAFLRPRFSCFASLHVRNSQFEEVRLAFRLRLREGYDETFYVNKAKEEITRFLSPWAFPGGGPPSFGGKIRKSVLIDLVEELPWVDYVTDFRMFHDIAGVPGTSDRNEVEGSKAVSVLVSAPPASHAIEVIHEAAAGAPGESCPCEAS